MGTYFCKGVTAAKGDVKLHDHIEKGGSVERWELQFQSLILTKPNFPGLTLLCLSSRPYWAYYRVLNHCRNLHQGNGGIGK